MIACSSVSQREIRFHYDLATLFYRLLWGRHIHHGLWNGTESPAAAQQQLIDALAAGAVRRGDRVVDVGCGMGGSSIHLAQTLDCRVTGITLSAVQRAWAACSARWQGVSRLASFVRADAERIDLPAAAYDIVWSIECTEHLFDKPAFFARASRWLRPGGRMAICAWLAAEPPNSEAAGKLVHEVCEGFLCPSIGTMSDYQRWMSDAGLMMRQSHDWTSRVAKTWEICLTRIRRARLGAIAQLIGSNAVGFLDRFETILEAYRTGAMRYGAFICERPEAGAA
jgi:tocopherol O-methyltransferase